MKTQDLIVTTKNIDSIQPFGFIKTVFSYMPRVIRNIYIEDLSPYALEVMRRSVAPSMDFPVIYSEPWAGYGLDNYEQPLLDTIPNFLEGFATGFDAFSVRYWTAGAHEGIYHALVQLKKQGVTTIAGLIGEYEGFQHCARQVGFIYQEYSYADACIAVPEPNTVWFISQPNAVDGNFLDSNVWETLTAAGHRIFLDISYLPAALPRDFQLDYPNVEFVAVSFSKPFGVFYERIGMLFCRNEVESLIGNKWFKNIHAILVAKAITGTVDLRSYVEDLKGVQQDIVANTKSFYRLPVKASDAFLLAHADKADCVNQFTEYEALQFFLRGDKLRFCLTPRLLQYDI